MTFDDILKWAPDNEDVFNELLESVRKRSVVPFVGAGMSYPLFPSWREVLDQLTGKLSSEKKREIVINILNDSSEPDAYTKAADKLVEFRSEAHVFKDLLKIINEEKINDEKLAEMTVFLLPFLFSDMPAITTNYDRVLEHVYCMRDEQFDTVFCPDSDLATMVGQKNLHCLFKIHGDVGKQTLDGRRLILSGESYDRVYKPNSELVRTLKTFFKGKMMLFLGSSLKYDRTLKILQQVTEKKMISHYAIMPCEKECLDDDNVYFGKSGIRVMFYDPKHHDAVKIILEEILRQIEPDRFRLYKSLSAIKKIKTIKKNPYLHSVGDGGLFYAIKAPVTQCFSCFKCEI